MQNKSDQNKTHALFTKRVLVAAAIIFSIILLLIFISSVFNVLLLVLSAILIASFFRGIAGWMSKHTGLSMNWTLPIALIGFLIVVVAVNWLLAGRVQNQVQQLVQQLPASIESARQSMEHHWWGRQIINQIPKDPGQFLANHKGWASRTMGIVSSTFGMLSNLYIVVLIGLFIMFNPMPYVNGLVSLVPAEGQGRAREVIGEVYTVLQRWLTGKLLSMLIVAVLTAIGLYILGVPLVLFLSLLAGLLAFIPNFGPIISLIPALLVAVSQSPSMALYVLILYIVVQIIESNFITPFIQREMVFLPLALIIIAQVVLGILVGGLGLVLATPIVAIIMVLVRMLYIEDVLEQEVVHQESGE